MDNIPTKPQDVTEDILKKVPTIGPDATVAEAVKLIRAQRWDTINYLYILDQKKTLIGVASIKELLRTSDNTPLKTIMTREPAGISAAAVRERASIVAIQKNIKAVPVFKTGTREFIGVVGPDKILDLLHNVHVEDFLKFSGIVREHPTVNIFKASVTKLVKARLPWLLIGLIGGMLGAFLVGTFETILKKEIALAFFIPVVVYISNAISTQTQALLLRLLASQKVTPKKFLQKEIVVSALLAIFSAVTIAVFSWLWLGSVTVGLVVGLAIFLGTVTAVIIATIIPISLYAFKKDPALGTGPFATALQDVASLLIYFLIAKLIIF